MMFRNKSKNARPSHLVRVNVSGNQNIDTLGFSIEPPVTIHDPEFMGDDFRFTFSDDQATYGVVKRPAEADKCHDTQEEWQTIKEVLRPAFQEGLQTFLGRTGVEVNIIHGSGAEM